MSDLPSPVFEQFDTFEQRHEAATLGMWIFLLTEVMFFGGLFTGYTVYRVLYPDAFRAASLRLSVPLGATNTAILLASSLMFALAVHTAGLGRKRLMTGFLLATIALGSAFLGIKGLEYFQDYRENLIPGTASFSFDGTDPGHAEVFFGFYFTMTGIHALHMIIGISAIAVLVLRTRKRSYGDADNFAVETTALYWHFVDIVWIFLFPMLYLIGRSP